VRPLALETQVQHGPGAAIFGGQAPCSPVQKAHAKLFSDGKREGRLAAPGRPGPCAQAPARGCATPGPLPGPEAPFLVVKRPARPYKSAIQTRFT
jgi:hypothetical protein